MVGDSQTTATPTPFDLECSTMLTYNNQPQEPIINRKERRKRAAMDRRGFIRVEGIGNHNFYYRIDGKKPMEIINDD